MMQRKGHQQEQEVPGQWAQSQEAEDGRGSRAQRSCLLLFPGQVIAILHVDLQGGSGMYSNHSHALL